MSNNCPHCAREHSHANLTQFFTEVFNTLSELRPGWHGSALQPLGECCP